MISFFIDPSISQPETLRWISGVIKKRNPDHVVCFFNQHQADFFNAQGIKTINYSTADWPMEKRNSDMEAIMQGFNDRKFKPESDVTFKVDNTIYTLNVFRFLSANFLIKGLFLPVSKTMGLYLTRHQPLAVTVFGGAEFNHHVTFCLERNASKQNIEWVKPDSKSIKSSKLRQGIAFILDATKILSLVFVRRIVGKKIILIPRGNITEKVIPHLNSYLIIHSINRVITRFKPKSRPAEMPEIEKCFYATLQLEKEGKDHASQLAVEILIDFLKQGYLDKRMKEAISIIRILNIVRPAVIVQLNLNGELSPYEIWAASQKVPSICIQHGIQGRFAFDIRYDIEGDHYFAWADLPFDLTRNKAVVSVFGNPTYTQLPVKMPVINKIKNILIAPTALPYYKSDGDHEFWHDVIGYMKSSEMAARIKFHHKDRFKGIVLDALVESGITFEPYQGSIQKAIQESDLILTMVSTVALDAFQYNKPVVILNHAFESEFFTAYLAGKVVYEFHEIAEEVNLLSSNAAYYQNRIASQAAFYTLFYQNDSGRKMADKIMQLVEQKR